ncbi:MAG: kinase-like domain-containing protein [Monoraphidium minutum]|nr:MAG: kinase-like domain-containing protein [Monoraphidium minutum]
MGACCSRPEVVESQEEDATGGLSEAYDVKHLLGSGSAGDTWLCQDRGSGDVVAIKLIKRPIPAAMSNSLVREVKIGAELGRGHLNIVRPREVVLTRTHLGLVMDYVAGGNMADYILKSILLKFGDFDRRDGLVMEEDEALYFFKQIISAVAYCHEHKVAHRDLKMDNTLLDDHDPPRVMLCDFGFARHWMGEPQMTTITGTPDYMSPQLLGAKLGALPGKEPYDGTKADIWAAGVMLCVMLIGRFPFEGIEMHNVHNLDDVSAHVWQMQTQTTTRWHDNPLIAHDCGMLSPDCIDLLNRMFELEEDKRVSVTDITEHPWFNRPLPPLYEGALHELAVQQAAIDAEAAKGAYVSASRDSALRAMINAAAAPYNPLSDDGVTLGHGGRVGHGELSGAHLLRKISLTGRTPSVTRGASASPDGGGGGAAVGGGLRISELELEVQQGRAAALAG